jgi:hypothetical protein
MGKIKTTTSVFELPQRLGILQHVEYEPPRREWCTDGCLYEGFLTAEGCRRGVCVRYRVWAWSKDKRRWEVKEKWRRRRDEEAGGCIRQQVADAIWQLAERGYSVEVSRECDIIINGVAVSRPHCRTTDECVEQMLEEYRRRLESPPPPRRSPEEEEYETLLQRYAWLGWWNRNVILDALRRNRHELLDLLQRLDSIDVPHIKTFLGRFDIDMRCLVEIYKGVDGFCIAFCIKDSTPTAYCYEPERGWYHAPRPKFQRLKPQEDGTLAEIYTLENKELVRIA